MCFTDLNMWKTNQPQQFGERQCGSFLLMSRVKVEQMSRMQIARAVNEKQTTCVTSVRVDVLCSLDVPMEKVNTFSDRTALRSPVI